MSVWTYAKAGVPHLKGDPVYNRRIKQWIASTRVPGVLGDPIGFASLFDIKRAGIRDPLLVTCTDGVGTKLEIARLLGIHHTIGIDLVAMCVNDLITCGAKPIIFLDYYATGKFDRAMTQQILKGIVAGCRQAGCALVGGETAVMPGFYETSSGNGGSQYDLAGFAVGLVDRRKRIDVNRIRKGDILLGVASSGVHSNGFSLLRKIFSKSQLRGKIGRLLLKPTRIYAAPVLQLLAHTELTGIVHITGGGLIDNLPRVIPAGLSATINTEAWLWPKLFHLIQDSGSIPDSEMLRTFNLGIGLVLILRKPNVRLAQSFLKRAKLDSWVIGEIIQGRSLEVL